METEHGSEKVLFELRANADGSTTITTSAEWDAYHAGRRNWRGRRKQPARTSQQDLRAALQALETIYSDLYAESTG